MKQKVLEQHRLKFNTDPAFLVFAPGRVNFIGEHTDYNGGLVMPLALDKGVYLGVSANNENLLRLNSVDFQASKEYGFDALAPDSEAAWANIPLGAVKGVLGDRHPESGMDITLAGDLPIGAGLSSSAAVAVAAAFAVRHFFDLDVSDRDLAFACQKAEHEFTGARCGIMDQMICILGRRRKLLEIFCDTLDFQYIPFLSDDSRLLVTDSGVSHELAQSEYNARRTECEEAFSILKGRNGRLNTLSDCPGSLLEKHKDLLNEKQFKRVRHVLSENLRVREASAALKIENTVLAGALLTESHESLKTDFEVSCPELDFLVENALSLPGVYGSRMTGGGFGGSTVTLVRASSVEAYKGSLKKYQEKFGREARVIEAVPSDGVRVIPV